MLYYQSVKGSLIALDGDGLITDVYIEMDSSTAKKIANVASGNKITRENQEFIFKKVKINNAFSQVFMNGQNNVIEENNRVIVTSTSRSSVRYKGIFKALVSGDDGQEYVCNNLLSSISFNVENSIKVEDDYIIYENVSATIFNSGKYQEFILSDD